MSETTPRAPAGVEQYGVEPVPPELRTTRWLDLFGILFTWNLSPLVFVLGALAATAGGLPVWWAAGCMGAGALAGSLMLIAAGRAGVEHGLPGQVAMRGTFGLLGARGLTSPYRLLATCYWFAAQALAAAIGVRALVKTLADYDLGLVPTALVVAAIGAVLATVGFDALRWFVRFVLPLTVVTVAVFVALFLAADDPGYSAGAVLGSAEFSASWVGLATFISAVWGGQLTAMMSVADFCRYARSVTHMQVGIVAGTTLGTFIAAWIGAYAAVASGLTSPFAAAAEVTGSKPVLALLLLAVLAQAISVNIMNVYNGGLSLVNTVPRLGRFLATVLVSVASVALSAFPDFIREAEQWFIHLGNVAAPISGVLLVDYVLLKRRRLDVAALFDPAGRYRFLAGVNPAALLATGVGVVVYYAVPDTWLKVVWGLAVAAALYAALVPLQGQIWPRLRDAHETPGAAP